MSAETDSVPSAAAAVTAAPANNVHSAITIVAVPAFVHTLATATEFVGQSIVIGRYAARGDWFRLFSCVRDDKIGARGIARAREPVYLTSVMHHAARQGKLRSSSMAWYGSILHCLSSHAPTYPSVPALCMTTQVKLACA